MHRKILVLAAAASLAAPAAASAHVTVNPREVTAESFTILNVRVPNERDNRGTVKVDLRLPDGFYFVSYKKLPGWKVKLTKERLERPVDLGGFSARTQVKRIVWTGDRRQGIIEPDQFEEFALSVRVPSGPAGSSLMFKAYQTYEGGERVAWNQSDPEAARPAPRVRLAAAQGGH